MNCSPPASFVHGFSRQEYWSGLPFPSPGDFPNPGIEPWSPELQADSLPSKPPGKSSTKQEPKKDQLPREPMAWRLKTCGAELILTPAFNQAVGLPRCHPCQGQQEGGSVSYRLKKKKKKEHAVGSC